MSGLPPPGLVVSCLVAIFLTPWLGSAINVALPAIGRTLGLGATGISIITTAYLVAATAVLLPAGKVADRLGRKRVFTVGVVVVALSAVACGCAWSATALVVFRVLQGLGSALIFTTAPARLAAAAHPSVRGRVLGLNVAAVYLALALGPAAGGLLTDYLGWRWTFWSVLPVCGLALVLEARNAAEPPTGGRTPFDLSGSLVAVLGILAVVGATLLVPSAHALWPGLAGLALLIGLVAVPRRHPDPILARSLWLGNRTFALSNLAALINYGATFAVGFLLSLYLQYNAGLSPRHAGFALMVQPALMACLAPLAGRWSDRRDPGLLASLGMALSAVALAGMGFLPESGSVIAVFALQIVFGAGFALFSSPNANALMGSVASADLGTASASISTMRLAGQMLSMAIVLAVFRVQLGDRQLAAHDHAGFVEALRLIAWILAALCAAGIPASLARGRAGFAGG